MTRSSGASSLVLPVIPGAVAETELQFFLSRLAQDLVEPEEEPEIPPGEKAP